MASKLKVEEHSQMSAVNTGDIPQQNLANSISESWYDARIALIHRKRDPCIAWIALIHRKRYSAIAAAFCPISFTSKYSVSTTKTITITAIT